MDSSPDTAIIWRSGVRITNGERRLSGVILAKQGDVQFVASAAHGFDGRIGGQCQAWTYDGKPLTLTLRSIDRDRDYALLELPPGEYTGAEPTNGSGVMSGEPAIISGWDYDNDRAAIYRTKLAAPTESQITTTQTTVKGFSGGGLFVRGKLVGIHTACSDRAYFCPLTAVHEGYHRLGHSIAIGLGWCPRCPKGSQGSISRPLPQTPTTAKRRSWLLNVVDLDGRLVSSTNWSDDDDTLTIRVPSQSKAKDYDGRIADLERQIAELQGRRFTAQLLDGSGKLVKEVQFDHTKPLKLQLVEIAGAKPAPQASEQ